jgi:hypothetical protein
MPRKVVRTETQIIPDDNLDALPFARGGNPEKQQQASFDESEGVKEYLQQFNDEQFRVKVYKDGPAGPEFCFSGSNEVTEELIQKYGGGSYELRVFVDGVKQDTVHLKIADRPTDNNGNEKHGELELMRQQMQFMQNFVLNGRSGNTPSTPIVELIDAVKSLNGLNSGSQPVDLILKGMELAKGMTSSGGDWKTSLIDAVKDIGKAAVPVLATLVPQGNNVKSQGEVQEMPSQEQMLREGIAYLKGRAMAGMDCNLVVDWIVANSNDPQYTPFIKMVLQQDFDTFVKIDAEIAQEPFLSWFRTLHSGLRDSFNEVNNAGDSGREFGHVANIADHGPTGAKRGKGK